MTKQDLIDSREGIPPMGNKTRNPRAHTEKMPASELTRTKIAEFHENQQLDRMYNVMVDFE